MDAQFGMSAQVRSSEVRSRDGRAIHVHDWTAEKSIASLLVVHGYFEHGARYADLARALNQRGISIRAVDLRGHGRSDGPRGHVNRFDEYLDDVTAAFDPLTPPRFVLGHSLGGLIALTWASARPDGCAGLCLSNPYLDRAMVVPRWKIVLASALAGCVPRFAVAADLDPSLLTHDAAMNGAYKNDPLIFNRATARWFIESNAAMAAARNIRTLQMPLNLLLGDGDAIANPRASLAWYEAVQAPQKSLQVWPGLYHEILNEPQREEVYAVIGDWITSLEARCV